MPQLRIEQEDAVIGRLTVDNLKSAVAYVNEHEDLPSGQLYIYATINEENTVENTVTIRKKPTESQWK